MANQLTDEGKEKLRNQLLKKGLKLESYWKKEAPVYTGRYKNSITTNVINHKKAQVGTNLDYARNLEFGLGQGNWPPTDEIKKWVDRKINPSENNLDDVTFLVQRKIFQQGVERNPSLQRAIRKFKTNE